MGAHLGFLGIYIYKCVGVCFIMIVNVTYIIIQEVLKAIRLGCTMLKMNDNDKNNQQKYQTCVPSN